MHIAMMKPTRQLEMIMNGSLGLLVAFLTVNKQKQKKE
jgi:hypothetical protein